ncbi:hypothetical protein BS50DRAFT_46026 [Corynespora cassiicola Philippines]|uniref:Uncharacterized protein n=1 Tax=Corynespora cassiicola Philippines TaxID=1448308 RepID=A0A2T2NHK5_CORCC|nr:hypothetical protein BS50DRAFT_46026 [Corynespora cassiicola Philippines]
MNSANQSKNVSKLAILRMPSTDQEEPRAKNNHQKAVRFADGQESKASDAETQAQKKDTIRKPGELISRDFLPPGEDKRWLVDEKHQAKKTVIDIKDFLKNESAHLHAMFEYCEGGFVGGTRPFQLGKTDIQRTFWMFMYVRMRETWKIGPSECKLPEQKGTFKNNFQATLQLMKEYAFDSRYPRFASKPHVLEDQGRSNTC